MLIKNDEKCIPKKTGEGDRKNTFYGNTTIRNQELWVGLMGCRLLRTLSGRESQQSLATMICSNCHCKVMRCLSVGVRVPLYQGL